ncbi:ATP-binding cassette domain-containing protein [Eubacteriales bacterium OttesenSCG-928-A19]|nr:ATP-binding cassette domain-containing protein [Eubacteriales bacterium OttesenSCG-928-A19]
MIDIQGLRKVFPAQGGEIVALDRIDLKVRQGDIFGIIGMSGAGKSTLIRCINRLEAPTDGRILIEGTNILAASQRDLLAMRRSVGMIFQQFNLLMQRTVEKNVLFPMEIAGVSREEARARAAELLELVGLEDKAKAYPAQLSGGQKQRVAIARALATSPDVLLCDEATSALDPMTTQSILGLLQDINQRLGITILLITHEMQVIRQICTQVAIIDNGRIAEQGDVTELFTNPRTPAARKLFRLPAEGAGANGRLVRIVFDGSSFDEPVIANMALHCNISVSILSAEIRRLKGQSFGQMVVRLPEDEASAQSALAYLRQQHLTVEEVDPSDNEWAVE